MAKPGHQAFGILAGVIDGNPARLLDGQFAPEVTEEFGSAMRFQARPARIGRAVEHGAHLSQHARLQHGVEAALDALAPPAALRRPPHRGEAPRSGLSIAGLPGAKRPAGRGPDLPGPDMALAIAGLE